MGLRRGLGEVQLRAIQLADLRLRAEAERIAVSFARIEHATEPDAAARPSDANTEANKEAIKQNGNSSLDSAP